MADFALGLTKKAVEGTLSKVQSAIDEEDKQRASAQQDLVFITGEFQMMQAFLSGANKERAKNQVVKAWVRQLRDLAFDVEDCVELVVHLDNGSAWSCLWRIVPSFMRPRRALELDMAVAELKQFKERVWVVSQRNTRYNLTSDSGSTPTTQENQLATAGPSTLDTLKELWAVNMKRSRLCDLQELITHEASDSDRKVISIWTSAGAHLEAAHIINTTTSGLVMGNKFELLARVKLMYPFNLDEFLKSLLTHLYMSSHQEKLCAELRNKGDHLIQEELMQILSKHKYLIIVEDLSSVMEWNFIKQYLPDIRNGSRIVISTEQLGVALACTGEPYLVSELRRFPDGRFLHAFFKSYQANINISELFRRIGERHRVISLWGAGEDNDPSKLVRHVYDGIFHQREEFKGVNYFEDFLWLDVPLPFNSENFYRYLMYKMYYGGEDVKKCCQFLSGRLCSSPSLVVINGLQSTKEWDLIKETFVPDGTKSCIIVIANEAGVASYCENHSPIVIQEEEKEANAAIRSFTKVKVQPKYCYNKGRAVMFRSDEE